jgi:hypothetical protein
MRAQRKTDPIDDVINQLNKPILLLRELKKAKQEIAQLKYVISDMEKDYSKPIELEKRNAELERSYNELVLQEKKDFRYRELHDLVMALSQRNGQLEEELKRLKNATS